MTKLLFIKAKRILIANDTGGDYCCVAWVSRNEGTNAVSNNLLEIGTWKFVKPIEEKK